MRGMAFMGGSVVLALLATAFVPNAAASCEVDVAPYVCVREETQGDDPACSDGNAYRGETRADIAVGEFGAYARWTETCRQGPFEHWASQIWIHGDTPVRDVDFGILQVMYRDGFRFCLLYVGVAGTGCGLLPLLPHTGVPGHILPE